VLGDCRRCPRLITIRRKPECAVPYPRGYRLTLEAGQALNSKGSASGVGPAAVNQSIIAATSPEV
jgi:hypothetical protein